MILIFIIRTSREDGKEYKEMTQRKGKLAEHSLEIVSYDRAVVVKLN